MTGGSYTLAGRAEEIKVSSRTKKAMNPFTLRFADDALEKDFRQDYYSKNLKRVRYSLILGIIVYAAIGLLDAWMIPEVKQEAWYIRYAIECPFLLICLLFTFTSYFRRFMQATISFGILFSGAGVLAMIALSDAPGNYLYYAGLILITMFAYNAVGLRFVRASVVSCTLLLAYQITAIWILRTPVKIFANNTIFFIAANVVGMFAGYTMEAYMRRDFLQKRSSREILQQLGEEIEIRKRQESFLRDSEEKYRALIDGAGDAIVLTDEEGRLVDLNRKAEEMLGYTKDEFLKMSFRQLYPEHTGNGLVACLPRGEGTTRDVALRRKDGKTLPVDIAESVIACGGRKVTQAIIRDITDRKEAEEALRKAKARAEGEKAKFESIIGSIGDAVTIQDTDFKILYQNPIMTKVMGARIGEYCYRAYHGRDQVCEDCLAVVSRREDRICRGQRCIRGRDGEEHLDVTASPLKDEYGNIIAVIEVVREISERIRMEKELEQYRAHLETCVTERTAELTDTVETLKAEISERKNLQKRLTSAKEQLESFISSSADAIAIVDAEGTILQVNNAFEELYGWSSHELVGNRLPIFPPGLEEEFQSFLRKVRVEESVCRYETVRRRKDGELVHVSVTLSPVYEQGRIVGIAGITRDITARKQTEEALVESEMKFKSLSMQFHTLLDSIPDVIVLLSRDLRVLWSNISGTSAFDQSISGMMVGGHCYEIFFEGRQPCEGCNVLKCFASGEMQSGRMVSLDGRFWETRAIPLKGADGGVTSAMVIRCDVTEKIRLQEAAMRRAHLISLGELAAGVAHEINNPINGIINYAQLLLNESESQNSESDIAGRIMKEGVRIANIVGNLLSFAREKTDAKVAVDLRIILAECLDLIDAKLRRDGVALCVEMSDNMPPVLANPQQIEQVFLNILHNAHYAMNEKYPVVSDGKTIDILGERVRLDGADHARITFLDRGTGIAASLLGKVLNPFFTTKPPGAGTGLGLSLSHGIVSDHGGRLTIDSVEGEFTMVAVELPAMEER